ncbi:hypothetical protein A3C21_03260 [Candidatus Kaiserbacteria bacterium RIFCSPHIGHO2_02_FULL_59_21]|uniref:Uncharacterized protein n=1 Tax=Candidatus Kaiserbacteria bacterium RIFCSPHIGHO2_02_FULL_59_21 TaxID=1798500 RepID=A0A1F6DZ41_9BACT|nr:MAG: hypothetical protein A2766_00330 [Candidatus Kaiserbacteria bacterium RIFCSPHIGHO2_01_FULL_58_22]OGG66679.1 MAG: hypothetical protein A3C21_03260 [Candidatus Kaiserbacteria bacterium RIFCSPHIGHO2_02_FULL_59_21]OGG79078.1 MAG: hypothetical protein A2952_02835 [Candidatus Kaiserbacteria bacterium RIFCSPLOWO2_01_FULL_59_34]OGG84430.1 MAG: hypothetical protein A3I47_02110 [Candidatus Kaiserbacteria bacterium RIFCSPLOWO2_02_FULL_59_19]
MAFQHDPARWHTLSLAEQLGNIGSEVHRARMAEHANESRFIAARDRSLELFDLTLADPRWKGRLREIARAREVFCDAAEGGKQYQTTIAELEPYFDRFAMAVRK